MMTSIVHLSSNRAKMFRLQLVTTTWQNNYFRVNAPASISFRWWFPKNCWRHCGACSFVIQAFAIWLLFILPKCLYLVLGGYLVMPLQTFFWDRHHRVLESRLQRKVSAVDRFHHQAINVSNRLREMYKVVSGSATVCKAEHWIIFFRTSELFGTSSDIFGGLRKTSDMFVSSWENLVLSRLLLRKSWQV